MPWSCTTWKASYSSGTGTGSLPVATVDWCDAYAYCKGVGKRLCGKIGGGSVDYNTGGDDPTDQWYNACSSGGTDSYPYGNIYNGQTCNGADHGVGARVPVGSMTGCESSVSGYTGVYDLSGNAYEWEDSCDGNAGQNDDCRLRGGSVYGYSSDLTCAYGGVHYRVGTDIGGSIGFRCCSL